MRSLQEERIKIDAKLAGKETEIREWALKQLEDNYVDFNRLLNAKMAEVDIKLKQASLGLKPSVPIISATTSEGILSELTIKEAVENMGMGLKNELLQLFEDDRRIKNIRFHEVFNMMDSNKALINEHIG